MDTSNGRNREAVAEQGETPRFPDVRRMTRAQMEEELSRVHGVNVHAPRFSEKVAAIEAGAAEAVEQRSRTPLGRWLARLDLAGWLDGVMLACGNVVMMVVVGMYKYLGASVSILIVFGAEVISNWAGNAVFDLLSHDTIRVLSGEAGVEITTELYGPVINTIALVGPGWAIALVAGYYGVNFMLAGRYAEGHRDVHQRSSFHTAFNRLMYSLGFGWDSGRKTWTWEAWESVDIDRWDLLAGLKQALRLVVAVNGTVGRIGLTVLMVSLAEIDVDFFFDQQLLLYVGLVLNVLVSFLLLGIADSLILHVVVEHKLMGDRRLAKKAARERLWSAVQRQAADREVARWLAPMLLRARERMDGAEERTG